MSIRQYGETILEIDKSHEHKLEIMLKEKWFTIIHGGLYLDVSSGSDKERQKRYCLNSQKKMGNDTIFIGVGDSPNDISILNVVDIPILFQMYDGHG